MPGIVPIGDYPIGTVVPFAGPVNEAQLETQGWMYCNGNSVSRTTYPELVNAIGTAFGEGDGSSTFNLPDLRGRFQRGVSHGSGNDPDVLLRRASGSGGNIGDKVGSIQGYASGCALTESIGTSSNGKHTHTVEHVPYDNSSYAVAGSYQAIWNGGTAPTDNAGAHDHAVTGGGDAESRPLNAYCYFVIKFTQV